MRAMISLPFAQCDRLGAASVRGAKRIRPSDCFSPLWFPLTGSISSQELSLVSQLRFRDRATRGFQIPIPLSGPTDRITMAIKNCPEILLRISLLFVLAASVSAAQIVVRPPGGRWTDDCDFCLASQGISPLELGSSGARVDLRYLRLGNVYRDGTRVDNNDRERETHLTQQYSVFYALSSRLTVSGLVPIASRQSEILSEDRTLVTGNQIGLADVSLLLRFKPLVVHSLETSTIVSIAGGVKLPTGRTDGRDSEGNLLDSHIQLGTGSTDYLLGASGFVTFDRIALITNLLGGITGKGANGHTFGNSLNYDTSVRYKLNPEEYIDMQFFATIGINGEWRGRERQDGITLDDSGGNVTYVTAGGQIFFTSSISLEALFQYPVIHGLHGTQLGESYRIVTGVQLLF